MNMLANLDQMQLPSVLQNYTDTTDAMDYIATKESFPTLTIKGKQFRFRKGGTDTPALALGMPLPVVLLAARPRGKDCAKVFYKGEYVDGATGADAVPDCYSSNGQVPDATIANPVSNSCATCPMNAFGTARQGEGKACKDYKHIFVAAPQFTVMNGQLQLTAPPSPTSDVYMLRVPAGSLKNLGSYVAELVKRKFPQQSLVTLLNFDSNATEPKLTFTFQSFLPDAHILQTMDYVKSDSFLRLVESAALYDAKQEAATTVAGIPDDIQMPAALQQLTAPVIAPEPAMQYQPVVPAAQPVYVAAPSLTNPPAQAQQYIPPAQSVQMAGHLGGGLVGGPQLDADKMPWDARIHASTKTMTQDGRWKKLRGVDTQLVRAVMNEVLGMAPQQTAVPQPPGVQTEQPPVQQTAAVVDDSLDALNAMMRAWQ